MAAQFLGWSPQLTALSLPNAPSTAATRQAQRYAQEILRQWPNLNQASRARVRIYFTHFGPGAHRRPPHIHNVGAAGTEEELHLLMFRANTQYTMPKCRICTEQHAPQPTGANIPIGLDAQEVLACGCFSSHAKLEEWMFQKGMLAARVNMPHGAASFSTKEDRFAAMEMFENCFGTWTFDKMTARGQRNAANSAQNNARGNDAGIHGN